MSNECLQSYHSYRLHDNIYLNYYFVSRAAKYNKHISYQSVKASSRVWSFFLLPASQCLIFISPLQRNFS
ncbi:hypothetical protein CBW53_14530 [Yersinia frederiksenii]|nr:hypothetical protein CBW53_14530 [Yersinia frederiksenii]